MSNGTDGSWQERMETIYRLESRHVLATLIRLLGEFDLAEESLHEAFAAALVQWPRDGVPDQPRAWLITVGRRRGVDAMRRRRRGNLATEELHRDQQRTWPPPAPPQVQTVADDRLRLLFICCRPELPEDSRVALTLRELCGLTTEEIARAYLARPSTIAQRIVRAKQRIRDLQIPYEVPGPAELPARTASVQRVIYLVFNEGYSASAGTERTRVRLSDEAIRLARLLSAISPSAETDGLLALMLLQDARRIARTSPSGELVLLADQDRGLWDRDQIAEGKALVERALTTGTPGPYTLQAAIAAVHADGPDAGSTDWRQIVALYDILLSLESTPVVRLSRAIALAEVEGPLSALSEVDAITAAGQLSTYLPLHAARADLCRRLGRQEEALTAYERALELASLEPERRFIVRRIAELGH
ncbi:MAG: RNA polymerase sigma factor [Candidatus Eisenbacteria bacterium]|uniref:RNA polymerase sigma factor n=1 Tax=Eiseniibacteriota bacterium TaxID=2212470 RepID=A0A956NFP0_UNCEI|nr:RNA polymerase sigma factor [Candidatus Eisenbacteria bacterium]